MPKAQEQDRPQPRTKQVPSELDDRISYAVSNKGGVSVYGLRRFPFTFYKAELETILSLADELKTFMAENDGLLDDEKPESGKGLDKTESYTINASDLAIVDAEAKRLMQSSSELLIAGEAQKAAEAQGLALKYATIKSVAELNKNKVSPEQMLEIMTLKARK